MSRKVEKNYPKQQNDLFYKTVWLLGTYYSKTVIFRRAPNFKDLITSSYIKQIVGPHLIYKAFTMARAVRHVEKWEALEARGHCSATHSEKLKIKEHLTCDSLNVVYLLECPCGSRYVGHTSRKLKIHMGEDFQNIRQ